MVMVVMVVMVAAGCGHGGSRLWSWWQQAVVMVAAGCGHGGSMLWSWWSWYGGHGGSRLWSWWQQAVVMVAAGCGHGGHGGSRLWSWWSWWQQAVVMVVMVEAGCGHSGSRLWSWWSWWQQAVVTRLHTGQNRLNATCSKKKEEKKLAPSPTCNCSLGDQTAEHILQRMPASADSKNKCVANGSPVIYTPDFTAARRNWRRQLQTGLSV